MDKTVKPGDDFFLYVNRKRLAAAQIPPDRTSTGSFQDLQILSEKRVRNIVARLEAKPYDQGGATRNNNTWYAAFDVQPADKYYLPPDKRVRLW